MTRPGGDGRADPARRGHLRPSLDPHAGAADRARTAARYLGGGQGRAARRALPRERGADRPARARRSAGVEPDLDAAARPRSDAHGPLPADRARPARPVSSIASADSVAFLPYTDMGRAQLDHLEAACAPCSPSGVPGDIAEVGAAAGAVASSCGPPWRQRGCPIARSGWPTAFLATVRLRPTLRRTHG